MWETSEKVKNSASPSSTELLVLVLTKLKPVSGLLAVSVSLSLCVFIPLSKGDSKSCVSVFLPKVQQIKSFTTEQNLLSCDVEAAGGEKLL